jgi:Domain of unknown function (DUF4873)
MRIHRRTRARRHRPDPWVPEHDDEDGYRGPARLAVGDDKIDVEVVLGGHMEPLDGKYHWYGRIAQHDAVDAAKKDGTTTVGLVIADGASADGRLAEHDAWGNMRITGTGTPPFDRPAVEITHVRP